MRLVTGWDWWGMRGEAGDGWDWWGVRGWDWWGMRGWDWWGMRGEVGEGVGLVGSEG